MAGRIMSFALAHAALWLLLTHGALAAENESADAFFETRIRPVLMHTCFKCHGGDQSANDLRIDAREHLLSGGASGAAIVPGDPEASLLMRAITRTDEDLQMPPDEVLPKNVVDDFRRWIAEGATWPDKLAASSAERDAARHWSFRPVQDTDVDTLPGDKTEHPIDRFLLAGQQAAETTAAGPAEPNALLRRAYYDLIGLPPSPDAVQAFVEDQRPEALQRVIDELLDSPRYGERWGRHWLDLVRYADTAGDDSDYPIPEAYLYRDYVIDAFTADKPYDQFLHEQLAGDLLAESGPPELYRQRVIASGYIAQSKRFATNKHEDMHLIIEDTLNTTGRVMLGLTLRCARCHDHKYDPVTTEDYYALYGFFKSIVYPHPGSEEDREPSDLVPLVPEAELAAREQAFQREHGQQLTELEAAIEYAEQEFKDEQARDERIAALRKELSQINDRHPRAIVPLAYAVKEGEPVDVKIQIGGEPKRQGEPVARNVPAVIRGDTPLQVPDDQSGRLQLAHWITDETNPLTARVMVNRIWQHHFGRGLVGTPSNFGIQGEPPTHPELLDWLALRFIESGWSIKAMHRLIMTSAAYQRASAFDAENYERDPANRSYWQFDRRRLDAEAIRDTLLQLGGNLDLNRPGAHPFPPAAEWKYSAHHQFKAVYPSSHRSVYLMVQRLHPHPYLSLFNGPDTTSTTAVRDDSTVPLQALFMANGAFARQQAEGLAGRLIEAASDDYQRIDQAYRMIYARGPSPRESRRGLSYVAQYQALLEAEQAADANRQLQAWSSLMRVLLASNEFVYID